MRFFIQTHPLPCDKSGRGMMSSPTAPLFAKYEADFRCIELFNRTFYRRVSSVRPMSPELRALIECVADKRPDA
jgi:hypothetical protein